MTDRFAPRSRRWTKEVTVPRQSRLGRCSVTPSRLDCSTTAIAIASRARVVDLRSLTPTAKR